MDILPWLGVLEAGSSFKSFVCKNNVPQMKVRLELNVRKAFEGESLNLTLYNAVTSRKIHGASPRC
jgi:hypothetical protein